MRSFNPDKLRSLMKAHNLTGRELAQRVDLTNVSISRILHGKQKPSKPTVARLAEVFSVTPEQFYQPGNAVAGQFDPQSLAALRSRRNLRREDLASRTGITAGKLEAFESGQALPEPAQSRKLAEALNVETEDLLWTRAKEFSGRRLRTVRQRNGIAPAALAETLGIETQRLLLWEIDEQTPSAGESARLEQILGLGPGQLRSDALPEPSAFQTPATRGEILQRIEQLLASLTHTQCLQALAYIQGLITRENAPSGTAATGGPGRAEAGGAGQGFVEVCEPDLPAGQDWRPHFVPIIDNIAAGAGTDTLQAEQFPPGWAESFVAFSDAPEGAFAVRVRGDSMAPRYHDGDLIIVDPARQGRSGEPAVVIYQDPSTGARLSRLKRLRLGSDIAVLESIHPDYPPVKLSGEDLIAAYGVYRHLPRRPDASASDSSDPLGSLRRLVQRHRRPCSRDDSQSA